VKSKVGYRLAFGTLPPPLEAVAVRRNVVETSRRVEVRQADGSPANEIDWCVAFRRIPDVQASV